MEHDMDIGSGGACTGDTVADSLRAPCRPAVHGFNFHPSMVITGFFLDPFALLTSLQHTYAFRQVVSSSGNLRCFFFFLTRPHRLTIFFSRVLIVAWLVHICLHLVQRFLERKKTIYTR